jgi:hypothetical protein
MGCLIDRKVQIIFVCGQEWKEAQNSFGGNVPQILSSAFPINLYILLFLLLLCASYFGGPGGI